MTPAQRRAALIARHVDWTDYMRRNHAARREYQAHPTATRARCEICGRYGDDRYCTECEPTP